MCNIISLNLVGQQCDWIRLSAHDSANEFFVIYVSVRVFMTGQQLLNLKLSKLIINRITWVTWQWTTEYGTFTSSVFRYSIQITIMT